MTMYNSNLKNYTKNFPFNYHLNYDSPLLDPHPSNLRMQSKEFINSFSQINNHFESIGGIFGIEDTQNLLPNAKRFISTGIFEQISQFPYKYTHNTFVSYLPLELRILIYEHQLILHPENYRIIERLALTYQKLMNPQYDNKIKHYYNYAYSLMHSRFLFFDKFIELNNHIKNELLYFYKISDLVIVDYDRVSNWCYPRVPNLIKKNIQTGYDITFDYNISFANIDNAIKIWNGNNSLIKNLNDNLRDNIDIPSLPLFKDLINSYFQGVHLSDNSEYFKYMLNIEFGNENRSLTLYEIIIDIQAASLIYFVEVHFFKVLEKDLSFDILDFIISYKFNNIFTVKFAEGLKLYFSSNYNSALEKLLSAYYTSYGFVRVWIGIVIVSIMDKLNSGEFIYNGTPPEINVYKLIAELIDVKFDSMPDDKTTLIGYFKMISNLNFDINNVYDEFDKLNSYHKNKFITLYDFYISTKDIPQYKINTLFRFRKKEINSKIFYESLYRFLALYLFDFFNELSNDKIIDINKSIFQASHKASISNKYKDMFPLKEIYASLSKCEPLYAKLIKAHL